MPQTYGGVQQRTLCVPRITKRYGAITQSIRLPQRIHRSRGYLSTESQERRPRIPIGMPNKHRRREAL